MYKKTLWTILLVMAVIISSSNLWAGEGVDGSITYKANLIKPNNGESFVCYDIESYFRAEKFAFGLNTSINPRHDYLQAKPYVTWSMGKGFSLVGGLSTNSAGADYVHTGVWYAGQFGKVGVFVDPRYYFEVSDEANSYFDSFSEISYPLNDSFTLALDLIYDHWQESGDNWGLAGPVLYWKASKSITVFTRVARETNFDGGNATDVRVGWKWSF